MSNIDNQKRCTKRSIETAKDNSTVSQKQPQSKIDRASQFLKEIKIATAWSKPENHHFANKSVKTYSAKWLIAFLAKYLSKYLDIPVVHDCLCRVKKTKDQKGLNRTERLHNLDNAFMVRDLPSNIKNILIVDDVYTTGTTIEKCAKVLKDSGINKIYFLTICTGSIG